MIGLLVLIIIVNICLTVALVRTVLRMARAMGEQHHIIEMQFILLESYQEKLGEGP